MRKHLALLLAAVLLFGSLAVAGCGKKPKQPSAETNAKTEQTAGEDDAPAVRRLGTDLNILTLNGSTLLEGGSTDSSIISEALERRRRYVEETYDVTLSLTTVADGNDYSALSESYMAGLRAYDMVVPHPTKFLSTMMTSGMMQDLNSLPDIDTTKLWWNQSQVENFTVSGKLFFGVSDFNLNGRGFSVNVMNRQMFNSYFLGEDIYRIVFDGDWTLERMAEYAVAVSDPDNGVYGYAFNASGASGFFYGCGETLLKRNEQGNFEMKWNVEKCSSIAEKVFALVVGDQTFKDQWYNSNFPTSKAWTTFAGGKALILGMDIGAAGQLLADISFETAFLPAPKLNEEQAQYHAMCGAGFVGIPNDAANPQDSGLILEALGWHSYYNFRPVYFDRYMSYRVSKSADDYKVLELILDQTVYDLGFTLDSVGLGAGLALGMLKTVVIDNVSTDVVSYIRQNETYCNDQFQTILKEIY